MIERLQRTPGTSTALLASLATVLVVSFVTGGSSHGFRPSDAVAQLFALPVLALAVWSLYGKALSPLQRSSVAIAVAVAMLPALQLLPIPAGLWTLPAGRTALLVDLHAMGVSPSYRWSLAPAVTERAVWSEMPALAVFFGALALGRRDRRRLAQLVVVLVLAGLLLGLAQLQGGQDSVLNPFPQWPPLLDGFFANPNHQATALLIGAVLGVGLVLDRRLGQSERAAAPWRRWVPCGAAAAFLVALPVTESRAGMLLAAPALLAVLVSSRTLAWRRLSAGPVARAGVAIAAGVAAIGLYIAVHVVRADITTDARLPIAKATLQLARDAWPLGTGVGSFPAWFEQNGPDALLLGESINHAHNEYLQWALEGGLPALILLAAVLATLGLTGRTLWLKPSASVGHAAWIAVGVLLASSLVEYPLRTPALMTVGALLAGIAVAEGKPQGRRPGRLSS